MRPTAAPKSWTPPASSSCPAESTATCTSTSRRPRPRPIRQRLPLRLGLRRLRRQHHGSPLRAPTLGPVAPPGSRRLPPACGHPPAHVRHPRRQPHPNTAGNRDHRRTTTAKHPRQRRSMHRRVDDKPHPVAQHDLHASARRLTRRLGRLDHHRDKSSAGVRRRPISTPSPEQHTGVNPVAPRHRRDRLPASVALRDNASSLRLAPPPPGRFRLA